MSQSNQEPSLFERLRAGLEEGIGFARGELSLQTRFIPDKPPEINADEIVELRDGYEMTQEVFAKMLIVSVKTIRNWEKCKQRPARSTLRLLQILRSRPDIVHEVLGASHGIQNGG